jgi:SAM-dependent methyltransferase
MEELMKDYHDYVIRDGKFIGKFDEMYKECKNPWNQLDEKNIYSFSRTNSIKILKDLGIKSVVEFGCGLGGFTNRIYNELQIRVTGVDVSQEAIKKARSLYGGGGGPPHQHTPKK